MTPDDVIQALAKGELDQIQSAIKEELRELIPLADIGQMWTEATEHLGAYVEPGEEVVMRDVTLAFERGIAHLQIVYIKDEITGITMRPGHPTARFGE